MNDGNEKTPSVKGIFDTIKSIQYMQEALKPDPQEVVMSAMKPMTRTGGPVGWMYERLVQYISEFEGSLDANQEVGARLVSFGSEVTFHIDDLGYHGPDMITFFGSDQYGNRMQLIQHYTQMNVLLIALPKIGDSARRIGFRLQESLNEQS